MLILQRQIHVYWWGVFVYAWTWGFEVVWAKAAHKRAYWFRREIPHWVWPIVPMKPMLRMYCFSKERQPL